MNIEVDDDAGDVTLNIEAEDTIENLESIEVLGVVKDEVVGIAVPVVSGNVLCTPKVNCFLSEASNENAGVVISAANVVAGAKLPGVMAVDAEDPNVGKVPELLTFILNPLSALRFVALVGFI